MLENFIEYMWYLLTTPFKRVKKNVNAWYAWCKVIGGWFDECKEDLFKARDNGMVATCEELILNEHGEERRLTRYVGEDTENFRSRIAMYEEICKLGGTNEGLLLVGKTLGYNNINIKSAMTIHGDADRWAEFYIIINMQLGEPHPISFDILKKEIRKWKEVGAKDNYLFEYHDMIKFKNFIQSQSGLVIGNKIIQKINNINYALLKMAAKNTILSSNNILIHDNILHKNSNKVKVIYTIKIDNKISIMYSQKMKMTVSTKISESSKMTIFNDIWYFNGTHIYNGTKKFDAYIKETDL